MSKRELFITIRAKDCDREVFRSGGKGGQHQNKTSSGVRWRHRASGAVGESRESRSQDENARLAWRKMGESMILRAWIREQYEPPKEPLPLELKEEDLLIEGRVNGVWVKLS